MATFLVPFSSPSSSLWPQAEGPPKFHEAGRSLVEWGVGMTSDPPYSPMWPAVGCPGLHPESLDHGTLQLLWRQRELEIQALRWSLRNQHDTRRCYILQEVAGCSTRDWLSQEKLLQREIHKLTQELQEQKEQARLEKEQLEATLLQNYEAVQRLEAELHGYRQSCLLQLARSSWVGRVLHSSMGSVEVLTTDNLMDITLSDSSEDGQSHATGQGFRMEDVDWNSIAQRYPNLLSNMALSTDDKFLQAPYSQHTEPHKSVEWGFLPSSKEGTDSDLSSDFLSECYEEQVVPEKPPSMPASGKMDTQAKGLSAEAQDGLHPRPSQTPSEESVKTVVVPTTFVNVDSPKPSPRVQSSSLKIVAVNQRERYIRILNESPEETVDLSQHLLVQRVRDFPVCMYRFPEETLLGPLHHITVISLFQTPHRVSEVSRLFDDNTDLSIDCFPLNEADTGPQRLQPGAPGLGHGCRRRTGSGRSGFAFSKLSPCPRLLQTQHLPPQVPSRPSSVQADPSPDAHGGPQDTLAARRRIQLPHLSKSKALDPLEVPERSEGTATQMPQPLPVSPDLKLGLDRCLQDTKGHKVQVCRKRVDLNCPMVALSVQNTAESRFGFRFLTYPPITTAPLVCSRRV
ncbi:lamin tail domain-containing protein 2 [Suncus etruscus]|uniref:lamin tail domain-containing protein 2 n=1 Tax=Suncus etruscus TaxID=109475 RepID=UPI002110ADBD|nr:lamin tail domain-containing protein 2 [Suncus etruscus]